MFQTETHLHTAEVSRCSKLKAEEMVTLYHQAGYDTIFVSDHFHENYFNTLGDIPWEEQTAIFLSGYYKAKVVGERLGMCVLPAAEMTFQGAPNDYLAYGIDKKFLDTYPALPHMTIEDFYPIAKEHNIFLVQAHPFRDQKCYPTPDFTEAVEVFNPNPRHENFDDKCEEIAKNYQLYRTAGSDAHRTEDVARAGVLSETKITTVEDYISLIKSGKAGIYKGEGL